VYGCAGAARAYNPYTGAHGATRQGSNAYSQWGSSVVTKGDKWAQTGHYTDSRGTVAGARGSEGGRVVAGSGQNGSGFVGQSGSGDVYAGKDGNAYKKTDNGWQQYENGSWNPVDSSAAKANAQGKAQSAGANGQRPQAAQTSTTSTGEQRDRSGANTTSLSQNAGQRPSAAQSSEFQSLDRDAKARQQGAERTQKYQRQSRSTEGRSRTRTRRN
jgi:hypothetical protein